MLMHCTSSIRPLRPIIRGPTLIFISISLRGQTGPEEHREDLLFLPFLFHLPVCTPAKQEESSHDEETASDRSGRQGVASSEVVRYAYKKDGESSSR